MTGTFAPLLELSLEHEFLGALTEALEVLPTAETARHLRRGRVLVRQRGGVHHWLYQARDDGTPVASLDGQALRLGLRLTDTGLLNVTASDWELGREAAHFASDAAGTGLDRVGTLPLDRDHVEDELLRDGVLAILDLEVRQAWYGAAPRLELAAAARRERLRLYVVAQGWSAAELAGLSLVDNPPASDPRPAIAFETVDSAAFGPDELPLQTLAPAGETVLLYRSVGLVSRRQRARKGLRLLRDGEPILSDVPQPRATSAGADVVIRLSRPDS